MASVSYSYDNLHYVVCHPPTKPAEAEPSSSTPGPVQVELTMNLQLKRVRHHCLSGLYFELDDAEPLFLQETLPIRLGILRDFYLANQIIGPMFSRLAVDPDSSLVENCIRDVMRHGLKLANLKSNRGRKVLPLCVELSGRLVEHVNSEAEELLYTRALSLSELELERSNYGMVPAPDSVVRKTLKRVKVENGEREEKGGERSKRNRVIEGEACVICLEEFKVGSYASRMPCSHAFHSDCIVKWLKVGHDCPICGFEMPTASESIS